MLFGVFAAAAPAAAQGPPALALERASAGGQLEPAGRIEGPEGGAIHRYVQRVGGLPVLGAEAVVVAPPGAAPRLVADSSVAGVETPGRARSISRAHAIAVASAANDVTRLRASAGAKLGVDPASGRLAWEVSLPAANPVGDLLVSVDARTARVLRNRDLLRYATGTAAIFNPNPVVTQGSYDRLRDNKDRDSALLTGLRLAVSLERITSAKGCLSGTYVDARQGRKARPVCRASLDFTRLTRSDDDFEAVMAYYHIDRTRAYVDSLGLSRALSAKPQRVRVNAITDDNSYFSPMTRSMTLGSGGVDDGEDADVIIHEYGHSLQDQAVHNFGLSRGGASIGEGFGDYLAATMSAQLTGGSKFDACIFDWDGISYSKSGCGRRADKRIVLGASVRRCQYEPHCVGEAWSSMLLELRATLGADAAGFAVADRIVLESNLMLTRTSGFREAVAALLAADDLLYGGVHRPQIQAVLAARGFCPKRGC